MAAKLCLRQQVHIRKWLLKRKVNVNHPLCMSYTTQPTQVDDEDEIDKLRNVSRLPNYLRSRMSHALQMTPLRESTRFQHRKGVNADRLRYARFGRDSGIDPALMWPTRQELEQMKEDEKEWEPTLQEMWADIAQKKKEDLEMRRKKEENVKAQMERMPALIEAYRERLRKRKTTETGLGDERKAQLAKARDYFGFDMDYNDPRFQHMEALIEEEAKQARKKKKREEKAARAARMLAGLSDEKKD